MAALSRVKDDPAAFRREVQRLEQSIPKERVAALIQRKLEENSLGRLLVQTFR
jgi:hypothetical protein